MWPTERFEKRTSLNCAFAECAGTNPQGFRQLFSNVKSWPIGLYHTPLDSAAFLLSNECQKIAKQQFWGVHFCNLLGSVKIKIFSFDNFTQTFSNFFLQRPVWFFYFKMKLRMSSFISNQKIERAPAVSEVMSKNVRVICSKIDIFGTLHREEK